METALVLTPYRMECAWHPLYYPAEPPLVMRDGPQGEEAVSHGICPRCKQAFLKDCDALGLLGPPPPFPRAGRGRR